MSETEIREAVDAIWTLFRETDKRLALGFEETKKRFEETDRRLDERFAETDRRFAETDRRLDERFAATEREIAALAAQTRAAENLFIGKWGRLLEALVRPGVVELFKARGIEVTTSLQRVLARRGGEEMEIDLLLVDGDALVAVEVKTTLKVEDVREFLDDLAAFPSFFPEYRGFRLYGAVAALSIEEQADRFAYRQGLFVLTVGREGLVVLRNDAAFRPRDFGAETVQ